VQLSLFSCYLIPLWSKYSPWNPVLKHSYSPCSSLNVRDHVSHSFDITGRIVVFVYFNLSVPGQQVVRKKDYGSNGSKHSPNLVCSPIL
jgi:hypothetical protein